LDWLEWEDMQGASKMDRDEFLLNLIEDGKDSPPTLPEPLKRYRRFVNFRLPTFSGGVYNQPHLELIEFDVCESAMSEHHALRMFKQQQKA
jgi:hypothetical protein